MKDPCRGVSRSRCFLSWTCNGTLSASHLELYSVLQPWLMDDSNGDAPVRRSRRQRLREKLSLGWSGLSGRSRHSEPEVKAVTEDLDSVELADREPDAEAKWQKTWESLWGSVAFEGNDEMSLACERWKRSLAGERNTLWSKLYADARKEDWERVTRAVRAGVPPKLRSLIWTMCSGASTKKKSRSSAWCEEEYPEDFCYSFFVKEGLELQNEASGVIEVDVPRTGCEEAHLEPLRRILLAFAARNPILGYCQSMNFIAAALLRYCDEETAFWILCSLVEDILPAGYYTRDMLGIRVDMLVLNALVAKYLPKVHQHLSQMEVDLSPVSMNWFLCLYVNTLPAIQRDRVLDCLLHEGSKARESFGKGQAVYSTL